MNVHVLGMSHIDLGFVMPEEEFAELLEILAERMLAVLDRHPDVNYSIEQMCHYKKLKEQRPDLHERLKEYIQKGRIEVMGAMASTLETNFPSGESFIRNQALGLKWAKENFDVRPESAWLVDTFGTNAQVPQILDQFGFKQLFADRFGGDKLYDVFIAQGLDGTKMLVIGKDLASYNVLPDSVAFHLCRSWGGTQKLFDDADRLKGDGPHLVTNYIENEEVLSLRYMQMMKEREGRPGENWISSSHRAFVEDLRKSRTEFPTLFSDLNPEFTGTFSLRWPIKTRNRQVEDDLLSAEMISSFASRDFDPDSFDDARWKLAFNHFHDVFTGSHVDATYHSVMKKFDAAAETAACALKQAGNALTENNEGAFVLFNSVARERSEWVQIPEACGAKKITCNGRELPSAWRGGKRYCYVTLPSAGAVTCRVLPEEMKAADACTADESAISNEYMTLKIDRKTGAYSLILKDGTVVVDHAMDYLTAQEDIGGFQIESPHEGEVFASAGQVEVSPVSRDAMGESITVSGTFRYMVWNKGQNKLKWSIQYQLNHGSKAVKMSVTLDWFGEGTRIRLNVPTTVRSADAIYEIPFGTVERTAYRPRGTAKGEWPAQRFVAFEDAQKGIALINSGLAGVEVNGRTLSTTLLRAYYPGPMAWVPPTKLTSQHGVNQYEFMLMPYQGSWKDEGVLPQAEEFNSPVRCLENCELTGGDVSWLAVDCRNIAVSAVKNADDHSGDLVIRYYECHGEEACGEITVKDAESAVLSNVCEEAFGALPCADGKIKVCCKPYEIQTIRIKRK